MSEPEEIIRIAARGDGVTASGRHIAGAAPGDIVAPDGTITRYNVQGAALWQIREGDAVLTSGEERSFTSYSATSTTVATIFARRDARERLMKILADRVVADVLRTAPEWRP